MSALFSVRRDSQDGWYALCDDGAEACADDLNVAIHLATHLGHLEPDVLPFTIAIGPDHEVRCAARFRLQVRRDALLRRFLHNIAEAQRIHNKRTSKRKSELGVRTSLPLMTISASKRVKGSQLRQLLNCEEKSLLLK